MMLSASQFWVLIVALLAEGVDRNSQLCKWAMQNDVALLAEGVDRNSTSSAWNGPGTRRPPRGGRG